MRWDIVRAGMLDELSKIAEIDISGLSPQNALEAGRPAPPMETEGYTKALRIIDRAKMMGTQSMPKTAAPRVPFNPNLPQINRLTGAKKKGKEQQTTVERGKSLAGHTLGGMGVGRLVGEMAHGPHAPVSAAAKQALHGKRWYGAVAGGAAGAGEFVRKRIMEARARAKEKTSMVGGISSPAVALQASRKVARRPTLARTAGPSIKSQIGGSLIGRKFVPPGA